MTETGSHASAPVNAKVALVEPESMTVLWMNEAALKDAADAASGHPPVASAIPLAETLGIPDALQRAKETGEAQHMRASLVSTSRGGLAVVASCYRLPSGDLLVVIDEDWQAAERPAEDRAMHRRSRRPRG